jgi:hypothetical protein
MFNEIVGWRRISMLIGVPPFTISSI